MGELIEYLIARGALKSVPIIDAFREVDRADFVLPEDRENAYADRPLSIGFGQTISQPTVVAFMLEWLSPAYGMRVLDVGSGSGWTTALLAHLVGKDGKVWGMEKVSELVAFGSYNLSKYHFPWAEITQSGDTLGLPAHAPFDRILVSAAAKSVPPKLLAQLKTGGIMVIPIQEAVWQIKKTSMEKYETKKFEGFAFVPLIDVV